MSHPGCGVYSKAAFINILALTLFKGDIYLRKYSIYFVHFPSLKSHKTFILSIENTKLITVRSYNINKIKE